MIAITVSMVFFASEHVVQSERLDEEFTFMSGLIEWGLSDYAETVLDQLVRMHPELNQRSKLIQVEIFIAQKEYDKADELLQNIPTHFLSIPKLRLAMAHGCIQSEDIEKS